MIFTAVFCRWRRRPDISILDCFRSAVSRYCRTKSAGSNETLRGKIKHNICRRNPTWTIEPALTVLRCGPMSYPFRRVCSTAATGEQHGIAFKTADNGIRNFPVEQHATSTAVPVTISEEEEGDEVFSEARGTPVTVAESGNDDDRTPQEIAAALGSMRTPPNSTPAREVIGGSLQVGSGDAVKEEEEEQEEWCKGHVCLRLRPDGLRERRRGSASGAGMGLGGDAEEGSEDESGSDTDPAAGSDGEVRLSASACVAMSSAFEKT